MSDYEHQLHEDIGAYLLGALEEHERDQFEAHLPDCPDCREQLGRLRPAAEALPRSVDPLVAPPGLKKALVKTVRDEARERVPKSRGRAWSERLWSIMPGRMSPTVAWGSAAFVLLAGVALGFGGASLLDDGRTVNASVRPGQVPATAGGSLSIDANGKHGAILRVHGLVPLSRGRVYQAWVQRGGAVAPQPTFEVAPDGRGAVAVPEDLRDADAIVVTREDEGGARTPSEPPVMTVPL